MPGYRFPDCWTAGTAWADGSSATGFLVTRASCIHTLFNSQRSPASFAALTHSTSAFLPPFHHALTLRKASFANRFIKLYIPRTEVGETDIRAPHAARVLSRFKERCPKALNAL